MTIQTRCAGASELGILSNTVLVRLGQRGSFQHVQRFGALQRVQEVRQSDTTPFLGAQLTFYRDVQRTSSHCIGWFLIWSDFSYVDNPQKLLTQ